MSIDHSLPYSIHDHGCLTPATLSTNLTQLTPFHSNRSPQQSLYHNNPLVTTTLLPHQPPYDNNPFTAATSLPQQPPCQCHTHDTDTLITATSLPGRFPYHGHALTTASPITTATSLPRQQPPCRSDMCIDHRCEAANRGLRAAIFASGPCYPHFGWTD